jgi:hypothetical protein
MRSPVLCLPRCADRFLQVLLSHTISVLERFMSLGFGAPYIAQYKMQTMSDALHSNGTVLMHNS